MVTSDFYISNMIIRVGKDYTHDIVLFSLILRFRHDNYTYSDTDSCSCIPQNVDIQKMDHIIAVYLILRLTSLYISRLRLSHVDCS